MGEKRILNSDDLTVINQDINSLTKSKITKANLGVNTTTTTYNPGFFRFDDGSGTARLASQITKNIQGPWVQGNNQHGYDVAGTPPLSTFVYVFTIYNPTTDVTDVLLSSSLTSPVMPSGFTKKGRIDILRMDITTPGVQDIIRQHGNWYWRDGVAGVYSSSVASLTTYQIVHVPALVRPTAIIDVHGKKGSLDYELFFTHSGSTDTLVVGNFAVTGTSAEDSNNVRFFIPIDSDAGTIKIDKITGGGSTGVLYIFGIGWIDHGLHSYNDYT